MSTFKPTDFFHVVKTKLFSRNVPEILIDIIISNDLLDFYSVKTNMKKICNELERLHDYSLCSICYEHNFFHSLQIVRDRPHMPNDCICNKCVTTLATSTNPISFLVDIGLLNEQCVDNLSHGYQTFISKSLYFDTIDDWFKYELKSHHTTLKKVKTLHFVIYGYHSPQQIATFQINPRLYRGLENGWLCATYSLDNGPIWNDRNHYQS